MFNSMGISANLIHVNVLYVGRFCVRFEIFRRIGGLGGGVLGDGGEGGRCGCRGECVLCVCACRRGGDK